MQKIATLCALFSALPCFAETAPLPESELPAIQIASCTNTDADSPLQGIEVYVIAPDEDGAEPVVLDGYVVNISKPVAGDLPLTKSISRARIENLSDRVLVTGLLTPPLTIPQGENVSVKGDTEVEFRCTARW